MKVHTLNHSVLDSKEYQKHIKCLMLGILGLENNPAFDSEVSAWLDADGFLQVYAFIHPEEETWRDQFFSFLNTAEFAPLISSLEIKGPDKGTNGTRLYDLECLLEDEEILFSNLLEFEIEQTSILHENITMVTYDDYYSDNGAGGRILNKMPRLTSLTLPSAPSASFFERNAHPIEHLSLQAGFEHQQFIRNLTQAKCFPALKHFEWTDGPGIPRFTSCVPSKFVEKLKEAPQHQFETLHINKYFSSWKNSPRFYKG